MIAKRSEWLRRRAASLGASDTPVLIAGPAYNSQSALRIALEKRGEIPVQDRGPTAGHHLERAGRSWLAHRLGVDPDAVVDYQPARDDFSGWCPHCELAGATDWDAGANHCDTCMLPVMLHANLDGRVMFQSQLAVWEHKLISPYNGHDWPADDVPDHVRIQVNQQMLCSGLDYAVVVIFDCSRADWRLVVVEADLDLQAFIVDYTARWWQRYVVGRHDPVCDDWAERNTLARLRWTKPVDVMELPMPAGALELYDELEKQREIQRVAKKAALEPETRLREMLGSATALVSDDGLSRIWRDGRNTIRRKEMRQ